MTLLALSLAVPDTSAALQALQQAASLADIAELRLDLMEEFDLSALLRDRPLPVIVTCRPAREGGRWAGKESARLDILRRAAGLGADYVDLEWDCADALASFDRRRTRVILSRHDFSAMPPALPQQAAALWSAGADVVKLVGYANRLADAAPVLELLARATGPTIAIAMGACGLATRLLAFRCPHALLSFAALPGSAQQTAPGQIDAATMEQVYRVRQVSPATEIVGWLAGDANDAPAVVEGNRWLAARGCNARLIPLQLAAGEAPDDALARLDQAMPLRACLAASAGHVIWWTRATPQWTAAADLESALAAALAQEGETLHGS